MSTPATPMEVDPSPVVASTSVLPAELPRASTPTRKPKAPKQQPRVETLSRTYMREGDNVLLRLPSDVIKAAVISLNGSISLGKFGSFQSKLLIGRPYGDTYEIKNGQLHVLNSTLREVEETSATNEKIASTGAQGLSHEDIESLRNEGLSGREIIARQIEEHAAFELKTEFSKDKYLKRKEAKYLQLFTPIEPTVHNICNFNFEKQASKIRDLRPDTLGQIMLLANVRPGGRLLVVEDLHGMIVAAAVERMGGQGVIMAINDADSPPDFHLLESFNFSPSDLAPISSLHWAATEESYIPPDLPLEIPDNTPKSKSTREQAKMKKRRATFDKSQASRDDFLTGDFDAVIIACEYEPYSVLEKLLPRIAGSAPIVVYSPLLQVLHEAQKRLKQIPEFLSPSIVEPWLRKYQVLPSRSHPEMAGMGHGGYILTTTRVHDDAGAHSFASGRRDAKKRKHERETGEEQAAGERASKVSKVEVAA